MLKVGRLFLTLILAGAAAMAGDLTITFTSQGKGSAGGKEIHYYGTRYMRNNSEGTKTDTMVDYEKMVTYTIDHKKKKISFMNMDDALAAMAKANQAMPAEMAAAMGGMFGDPNDFSVDELGKEEIAGRKCKQFRIKVAKLVMELSADPTLKPPMPAVNYANMLRARAAMMAAAGPMAKSFQRLYEEMSKIQGIPLKTNMSGMMGMNVSTVAIEVKEGPVPASVFALPEGYTTEDAGKKMLKDLDKK